MLDAGILVLERPVADSAAAADDLTVAEARTGAPVLATVLHRGPDPRTRRPALIRPAPMIRTSGSRYIWNNFRGPAKSASKLGECKLCP